MMTRRPRWLPLLAALAATILFMALGVWQVERAGDKRALLASLEDGDDQPLTRLPSAPSALAGAAFAPVRLRGRFLRERQFLLDNRTLQGRPGFDVLTPMVLADGRTVLVDRGWVPMGPRREPQRPVELATSGPVTVSGRLWRPEPAVALGPAQAPGGDWPRVITRVDYTSIEDALNRDLSRAVIRAQGSGEWMLRPRTLEPAFGPARHYGYAFQWFALALTVIVITAVVWVRRNREDGDERG